MKKITNDSIKFMDAGTALIYSNFEFGTVMGAVKSEMEKYGQVSDRSETGNISGPDDFDFFLNCSSPLKNIYITCSISSCPTDGSGQKYCYAISFQEGNSNTRLQKTIITATAASIITICFMLSFLCGVAGIILGAYVLFRGLKPSNRAVNTCRTLIADIKSAFKE